MTADVSIAKVHHRLRLLAGCLFLAAIAFNTAPERIISETKIDMAVDPLGFLADALRLWDDSYFGHLQNQAYGYLFPMGPFYALGLEVGIPSWNVQRLWMALVLCVAFTGVAQLARALRIGSPLTGTIAGLAYALAPHAQALIGINSSEFLPTAVLPWILLPLVLWAQGRYSVRRAAALSALAFVCTGGVNATAVLAVLIVPLFYLLTRQGPGKIRMLLCWLAAVFAVSLWWLAPLVVLGRYIFSFLPYIETAGATTSVTSLTNVLRGTSSWISFLMVDGRDWVPAAAEQARNPWLIVATAAVAALGLAGLASRGNPERAFLTTSLLIGVLVVSAGHVSELATPLSGALRELFDGPLAPFRNLHKFDALVRLPLVLGLALLLNASWPRRVMVPLTAVAAGLVAVTVMPVAAAGVSANGAFWQFPEHWRDAATWLDEHADQGMVLAVPGSRRGEYDWGRPLDEPMQPLLKKARWATSANVPWGSAGVSRLMRAIDERFSTGRGSTGLTTTLRRMGVKYLLVRNDLDRSTIDSAWPARVHQAIEDSPGLRRVAGWGPQVGVTQHNPASSWTDQPYDSLEVYEVTGTSPLVGTVPSGRTMRATGGPEAILPLADEWLITDDRPLVIGDDPGAGQIATSDTVLTDTLRRQRLSFSDVHRANSATLTDVEQFEGEAPAYDLTDPSWSPYTAAVRYTEIGSIASSSAESTVLEPAASRDPGRQPYAAMDGDRRTGWRSDGWGSPVGEWLEVRFTEQTRLQRITLALERTLNTARVSEIEVSTDTGKQIVRVDPDLDRQVIDIAPSETTTLRLTVTKVTEGTASRVGILELTLPELTPKRTLVVPGVLEDGQGVPVALFDRKGVADPCMRGSYAWACSSALEIQGEDGYGFDRTYVSDTEGERLITGRATLIDPEAVTHQLSLSRVYPKVRASSTAVDHPAAAARSAMDGDLGTVWYAHPLDERPSLDVDLGKVTTLASIQVTFPDSYLGLPPVKLTVRAGNQSRTGFVGASGWFDFAKLRAQRFTVEFEPVAAQTVEVLDLRVAGVPALKPLGGFQWRQPCGFGPAIMVDGRAVHTAIVGGTLNDLANGRPVTFRTCEPVSVRAGSTRVSARSGDYYKIQTMAVRPRLDPPEQAITMTEVPVGRWTGSERQVTVRTDEPSYLVINENHNVGWEARFGDQVLTPVRLDGWRQAWVLPADVNGVVTMRYAPDRLYSWTLGAGWALVALVALLAAVPNRPAYRPRMFPARSRARWLWPAVTAVGLLAAGVAGAVLVALAVPLVRRCAAIARAEHAEGRPYQVAAALSSLWAPAAAMTAAGLCAVVGLGPAGQLLCVFALAHLAGVVTGRDSFAAEEPWVIPIRHPELIGSDT